MKTATRPLERLDRAQAQREVLARRQDEVADQRAVRVQPGAVVRDEDARRRRDRRDRGAAAVEDDDVGLERGGEPRALEDVRRERRTRHAAARAAAADRRHARERCGLEMVGRRVAAGTRERDEIGDGRRRLDQLRLGRAAPSHRDDDDAPVAREQPRDVRR